MAETVLDMAADCPVPVTFWDTQYSKTYSSSKLKVWRHDVKLA